MQPQQQQPRRSAAALVAAAASIDSSPPIASADVVVVGGGIIGLWCALSLLRSPENLSVALVEAEAATAGGGTEGAQSSSSNSDLLPPLPRATGAGQGYLWLAHRPPGTPGWDLAVDSLSMWRAEVLGLGEALFDSSSSVSSSSPSSSSFSSSSSSSSRRPYERTDWTARGSLLLAPAAGGGGLADCEARAAALRAAGLAGARALDAGELAEAEPALARFERGAGGLFVPSDVQINGRGAAADVLARCFEEGRGGGGGFRLSLSSSSSPSSSAKQRFSVVSGQRAASLVRPFPQSSIATGVRMASGYVISVRKAVVVAAGVWSGEFLDANDDERGSDDESSQPRQLRPWRRVFAPRRGHLLEVQRPSSGSGSASPSPPPLRHGVMELSYARHYDATAAALSSRRRRGGVSAATRSSNAAASAATTEGGGGEEETRPAAPISFVPSAADEELGVVFTAAPADGSGRSWLVGSSREEGGGGSGTNGYASGGSGSSGSDGAFSSADSDDNNEGGAAPATLFCDPLLDLSNNEDAVREASRPSPEVVEAILKRAALFLPELEGVVVDFEKKTDSALSVRVGLRPASSSGMPVVGRVPSFGGSPVSSSGGFSSSSPSENSNVIVAAGHEGSGLTLAPATASLVTRLVSGEPERALPAYYSALRPERAMEAARRRGRGGRR